MTLLPSLRPCLALAAIVTACSANAGDIAAAYPDFAVTTSMTLAQEVVQEVIQEEGLIPGQVVHLSEMMARTGEALGKTRPIYAEAVIVQFCSAQIAWLLAEEEPRQLSHCPLGLALYALAGDPGTVHIGYRSPGSASAAKLKAEALLRKIAATAQQRLQRQ